MQMRSTMLLHDENQALATTRSRPLRLARFGEIPFTSICG
jgi:hypothetical protein